MHRDLYKYSEKAIGGRFKNTQNVIAENHADGTQRIIFTPLAPHETPVAIEEICESFNHVIDSCEVDSLILIPIFIHDFLCVHPFNDGNGRMSRLLTTLLLYRQGYVVGRYISIESKIEKTKTNYYEVLEQCGKGWYEGQENPMPFVKYLLGIILAAYRDFESRINFVDDKCAGFKTNNTYKIVFDAKGNASYIEMLSGSVTLLKNVSIDTSVYSSLELGYSVPTAGVNSIELGYQIGGKWYTETIDKVKRTSGFETASFELQKKGLVTKMRIVLNGKGKLSLRALQFKSNAEYA